MGCIFGVGMIVFVVGKRMNRSHISWTERTWNPTFGCSRVSAGCGNCYGPRFAKRVNKDFFKVELRPQRLREPISLKEPSRIFVDSLSDLFHNKVPDSFLNSCFVTMLTASQHTYQILTKRPLRMLNYQRDCFPEGFPPNIWVGTSIESHQLIGRLDILKQVKASVRFVSFAPLLGSVMSCNLSGIQWVIDEGESDYHNPRLADLAWFREIRDECQRLGIPYFHKQNGGKTRCSCHKVWGCEVLDGKTHHEYPILSSESEESSP